jgi:hypothetical protein
MNKIITEISLKIHRYIYRREYQSIRISDYQRRLIKMMNMDQNKIAEVISQCIINKYMENVTLVKHRIIKLFTAMPYTGAPNISDAHTIAIIEDLGKFVSRNHRSSNN